MHTHTHTSHPQAQPDLATEPLHPPPDAAANAANQQEGGGAAAATAGAGTGAAATAAAPDGDGGGGGEAKAAEAEAEEGGLERRPVRLEDAEALKAFFLREPVKTYLLGHYKQKMLLEVGVVFLIWDC